MKVIKVNDAITIQVYASIKELPIHVRKKFDYYFIQDIGIGNTLADFDNHLDKAWQFIASNKTEDAKNELMNLRYNVHYMLNEWDFKTMSFACMVHSINGVVNHDRSDDGLIKLIEGLSNEGLTREMVEDILDDVKKNSISNLKFISPNSFPKITTTSESL